MFGEWKKEVAPTVDDYGVMAHKDCTVCARHFDNDGNEIKDLRIAKIGTHKVIVNGESKFYKEGESVTVTANEPAEGKVFKGWKDASGKIVSKNKNYTFTVKEGISLTAIFEDAPVGLSGGAIAGIIIACVAFLGVGGLAVFLFVIKKKTFAEVVAAVKGKIKRG